MAVGKVKKGSKQGKKGSKKRVIDPFIKKDWYDIKAPSTFTNRNVGKTLVNRTSGNRIASEALKGRVFEVSLSDLSQNEDSFRKFKLVVEEVQGNVCLTNFHGMDITRDMLNSKIKKRFTMIEAHTDAKTTDGYLLRMFCIAFTQREQNRVKATCYATHRQVRDIRKIMTRIMQRDITSSNIREIVEKLKPDSIAKEIERVAWTVRPVRDVMIRKVKVIRAPRFDLTRLMQMHDDSGRAKAFEDSMKNIGMSEHEDVGTAVEKPDYYEPPVQAVV